jgi:integrating conjugative element protein (TIGR03757 family)
MTSHRFASQERDMPVLPHALIGLAFLGSLVFSVSVYAREAYRIEVFTSSERPFTNVDHERLRYATFTTYTVDDLERFESGLSEGLPQDPEAAKTEALRRVQQLDDTRMAPAKNAAIGLAKAIQYGVDRYPAIVFDGRAVVYGVTDLVDAVERYETWQREQAR